MKKRIIFHHTLPLNTNAQSASGIRPLKMIEAFKECGYEVTLVTGYLSERKAKIKEVKEAIRAGEKFDFLYAENSTMPAALTEENHLPRNVLVDARFFKFCQSNGIKTGVFYRDIHWRFPEYWAKVSILKGIFAYIFYLFELWVYRFTVDVVFLPSSRMCRFIPIVPSNRFKPLPPATDVNFEIVRTYQTVSDGALQLVYVGGVNEIYQLQECVKAVEGLANTRLTICTREADWNKHKHYYDTVMNDNVSIVHIHGDNLSDILKSSDVALIYVEPLEYWSFAMPVKLFEYIGYELPIVASNGTMAEEFVESNRIGWGIDYDSSALRSLLVDLEDNRQHLVKFRDAIKTAKVKNTWRARVEEVSNVLN